MDKDEIALIGPCGICCGDRGAPLVQDRAAAADRASVLPHNTMIFNLCFIERQGRDRFREKGPEIKQRYYRGKMEIGRGSGLQ